DKLVTGVQTCALPIFTSRTETQHSTAIGGNGDITHGGIIIGEGKAILSTLEIGDGNSGTGHGGIIKITYRNCVIDHSGCIIFRKIGRASCRESVLMSE